MKSNVVVISLVVLVFSSSIFARSQCGPSDDRELSQVLPVGRMLESVDAGGGCTGTLISNSCVISAGHCRFYSDVIEFNTAPSIKGSIVHPSEENIYFRDRIIDLKNYGQGMDWMVFKIKPNAVTGLKAGEVQGYFPLSYEVPVPPMAITITGYGRDPRPEHNLAQQSATNEFVKVIEDSVILHNVDSRGGLSGAAIINVSTGEIIGVHTEGGCTTFTGHGQNKGTMLARSPRFIKAIQECLAEEN